MNIFISKIINKKMEFPSCYINVKNKILAERIMKIIKLSLHSNYSIEWTNVTDGEI
jgi:hypothetical protein